MSPFIAICVAGSSLAGAICAWAAERKNRSVAGWFVWGALFGCVVPLLVLWNLEPLPNEEWQP